MTSTAVLREFLLAFADDEHLMGQQHTEWIGVAPFLEEDLAFSSIGQDELGHAVLLYELVCEIDGVEPTDAAIDGLAYGRGATEYRSSAFTEYGTTDWAEALVRHWLYDMVEDLRWQLVADSAHTPLANAAVRAQREESYHRRHAEALMTSLLATPARDLLAEALDRVLPLLPSLFASVAGEDELVESNVIIGRLESMAGVVKQNIDAVFPGRTSTVPTSADIAGLTRTERSAPFAPLMARMREVLDLDPQAVW